MADVGNQTPTYSWCASYNRTQGEIASALSDAYALPPHPWQRTILNDWLAMDEDGKLLNSLCLLPVPRQNGKTGVCDPRETWGLIIRGEWILHTAQEYQTSKKAFDRLRAKFGQCKNDPNADYPELNKLVSKYTVSQGQMVLDLTNGGHIEFRTRGNGNDVARGGTYDLIVVDEAQSYTAAQDAALSPLNSAAPLGSPQTILMGTVPDPEKPHKGEVFANLRRDAHQAPYEGLCIHEWGADEIGDVRDRERWYRYNPSLGYQLLISAFEKDSRSMTPDGFAREHLGWWSELDVFARLISENAWNRCYTACPPKIGIVCYGVKFSPDGTEVALSVALKPPSGVIHVEIVKVERLSIGIQWLVDWLVLRARRASQIVIDGQSNAQELNERLLKARVLKQVIVRPTATEVGGACAAFVTAVNEGTVSHFGQEQLTLSATKSTKRKIGNRGGYGFESSNEGDATLVESAALAYWQATVTKRNPLKKGKVGC